MNNHPARHLGALNPDTGDKGGCGLGTFIGICLMGLLSFLRFRERGP